MRHTVDTNGNLVLQANREDRRIIKRMVKDHGCDYCGTCERDALEGLLANSDLDWIAPEEIGALTSAPILGMRDEEQPVPADVSDPYNLLRITSQSDGTRYYEPVITAWGFMDYQVRSFLMDLVSIGKAVFVSGS